MSKARRLLDLIEVKTSLNVKLELEEPLSKLKKAAALQDKPEDKDAEVEILDWGWFSVEEKDLLPEDVKEFKNLTENELRMIIERTPDNKKHGGIFSVRGGGEQPAFADSPRKALAKWFKEYFPKYKIKVVK